eukprot:Skav229348  [mRNA]  locus=scaffold2596:472491:473528:+ [translate_table: standard]
MSVSTLRTPRLIRVGTDFSGLDTALLALGRLPHIPVEVSFCCDNDKNCQKLAVKYHQPKKFFTSADNRARDEEVAVDAYIATPPCQPWSAQGKRKGLEDPRGQLLKVPLVFVKRHRPRLLLLENVTGLCHKQHRPVLKGIRSCLKKLDYTVFTGVLNSCDYKIAQQRRRLFLVAIRRDSYRRRFVWPKKLGKRTLTSVLDPVKPSDQPGRIPKNKRARALFVKACKKTFAEGIDPRKVPVAIDIGCTDKYQTFGVDIARTLCQGRAKSGGFWISSRGRKMSTNEMMRVSGLDPDKDLLGWEKLVSKSQFQGMLGNCVPVSLVGSVLQSALYSAGLISHMVPFPAD